MGDLPPKAKTPSSPHRTARGSHASASKGSPSRTSHRHTLETAPQLPQILPDTTNPTDTPMNIPPKRSGVGMRKRKRKIVDSDDDEELHLRGDNKSENKLGPTAVRFIEKLRRSPGQTMDLNDASAQLDVPKRRIYDITNVLEGLGTVVKTDKNTVRYGGARTTHIAPPEFAKTAAEIKRLDEQIQGLDDDIAHMQGVIDKYTQRGIYLLRDDVYKSRVLGTNPGTIILVRARPGTAFEGEIPKDGPSHAHFADIHPIHSEILHLHPHDQISGFHFYQVPQHTAQQAMLQAGMDASIATTSASGLPPGVLFNPQSSSSGHHGPVHSSVDYSLSGGDTTPSRSTFSTPTRPNHSTLELSPPPAISERYLGMHDFYSPARPVNMHSGFQSPYPMPDRFALSPLSPNPPRFVSPGPYSHHYPIEPDPVDWKDPEPPGGFRSMFHPED